MSAPQLLVQAVVNRLGSRLGSGLADAAASLAVLAREAPEKLQQDWDLFWEEVQLEAERLGADGEATGAATAAGEGWSSPTAAAAEDRTVTPDRTGATVPSPQEQIDQLRALVAGMARRLEGNA